MDPALDFADSPEIQRVAAEKIFAQVPEFTIAILTAIRLSVKDSAFGWDTKQSGFITSVLVDGRYRRHILSPEQIDWLRDIAKRVVRVLQARGPTAVPDPAPKAEVKKRQATRPGPERRVLVGVVRQIMERKAACVDDVWAELLEFTKGGRYVDPLTKNERPISRPVTKGCATTFRYEVTNAMEAAPAPEEMLPLSAECPRLAKDHLEDIVSLINDSDLPQLRRRTLREAIMQLR